MDAWRLATIDVGTNTVLLLIAEIQENRITRILEDRAEITRLGEGVHSKGCLGPGGQQRTLKVLRNYHTRCQSLNVKEIKVAGTSALRETTNARDFLARLKQDLGWDLRVLSPQEEAWYSYRAVRKGLSLTAEELLVVDVGGGSTEFIWGRREELHRWASLPMGTVKLTERFLLSDPVHEEECAQLIEAVNEELRAHFLNWSTETSFDVTVGVAGTFTTLGAVEKALVEYRSELVHGCTLQRAEIQRQIRLFKSKTLQERRQIPGLEPKRADVILAGGLLIDRVMDLFHIDQVVVSDQGIRYGLLYEQLEGSRE